MVAGDAKIRVAVSGALGRMGRTTCEAIAGDDELSLVAAIDPGSPRRRRPGRRRSGVSPA